MSDMTVAEVLTKAADLIEPEGAWTQKAYSRGAGGTYAPLASDRARCWCIAGAVWRVGGFETPDPVWKALDKVLGGEGITDWNDAPERTQAEVVAKLREAAERAKGGDQ